MTMIITMITIITKNLTKVDSALPAAPSSLEQLASWQSLLHTQVNFFKSLLRTQVSSFILDGQLFSRLSLLHTRGHTIISIQLLVSFVTQWGGIIPLSSVAQ